MKTKMTKAESCRKANQERWNPTTITPKATHSGILLIAGQEIACDVLEDGTRVLRRKTLLKAIGRSERPSSDVTKRALEGNIPVFVSANNLSPYLKQEFRQGADLIKYKLATGQKVEGYNANILPEVCKIYVSAEGDGVLFDHQLHIAKVCKAILFGLATVGITALVDDATGYVEERHRNELQKILEKYISEELRSWTKKFPNEFFKQVYRLHGWEYPKMHKNHPQYVGQLINKYVYERLPPHVLDELKKRNPPNENGNRTYRHHQFLTEKIGDDNLNKQIVQVVTLMKASRNLDEFHEFMERMSPEPWE